MTPKVCGLVPGMTGGGGCKYGGERDDEQQYPLEDVERSQQAHQATVQSWRPSKTSMTEGASEDGTNRAHFRNGRRTLSLFLSCSPPPPRKKRNILLNTPPCPGGLNQNGLTVAISVERTKGSNLDAFGFFFQVSDFHRPQRQNVIQQIIQ